MLYIFLLVLTCVQKTGLGEFYASDFASKIHSDVVVIPDVRKVDKIRYTNYLGETAWHSTRQKCYVDYTSNRQICQIMKYGHRADRLALIALITKLLPQVPEQEIISVLFANKTDDDFYMKFFAPRYKPVDFADRAKLRAEVIYKYMKFLPVNGKKKRKELKNLKLLEIGCGDGKITEELNKKMQFSEMHCIELKKHNNSITYHLPTKTLPFVDGYFDVILCSLSLHHVEDLQNLVQELYRVGSVLIMREHTCDDVFDAMLIDIEHMCYIVSETEKMWKGKGYGLPAHYPNSYGWDEIMKPFKWYFFADEYVRKNKNLLNPTKTSWMIYTH